MAQQSLEREVSLLDLGDGRGLALLGIERLVRLPHLPAQRRVVGLDERVVGGHRGGPLGEPVAGPGKRERDKRDEGTGRRRARREDAEVRGCPKTAGSLKAAEVVVDRRSGGDEVRAGERRLGGRGDDLEERGIDGLGPAAHQALAGEGAQDQRLAPHPPHARGILDEPRGERCDPLQPLAQ